MTRKLHRTLVLAVAIGAIAAPAGSAAPAEQLQTDRDFDWGDAGIGATGFLALAVIGAGAAVATGHRVRRLTPS